MSEALPGDGTSGHTRRGGAPMAITMGDASGVGPEIVLRRHALRPFVDEVVYGDAAILRHGAALLCLDVDVHVVDRAALADPSERAARDARPPLRVVDLARLTAADHRPGTLDAAAGAAARDYVLAATDDALAGRVAGIVTMPMNKEATQLSDPGFVGHTELVAERCRARKVTMMLTNGPLAVTHVSTHCSLREAIERVRTQRVLDVIELTDRTLRRFLDRPRVAVCGLNPHAGEHGLFGGEDRDQIAPAIAAARAAGIDASGPHPADTMFHQAVHRHRYDAIVCMYHDQGHGPMKLLAFDTGVNVTLGLPIIRTSVDHGTAFDIAWQGVAFTDSLDHALAYAWRLAGRGESDTIDCTS
jgi:4-phospho-D-threonate 3-dehydrogenase / 4-phospho-D-erythronate 3-dehydrogenase